MLLSVLWTVSAEDVGQLNSADHDRPRLRRRRLSVCGSIHGTDDTRQVRMSYVQIDRSTFRRRMPHQALDVIQVSTRFQEMCREAVAKSMYGRGFIYPGLHKGPFKNLLY